MVYLLRHLIERYRMIQQILHLAFIDLEKMSDRVSIEGNFTSVRTQGGETDDFSIRIGLHKGSTLNPYLFTSILNVLTEHNQELAPRRMFLAEI